jgi:hypothetical protein
MDELRGKLQAHLKSNGTLRDLKTQLRTVLLSEVLNSSKIEVRQEPNHFTAIADALVSQHLRATGRDFTTSIFLSETNQTNLNDLDALRAFLPDASLEPGTSILCEISRVHASRTASKQVSIGVQSTTDLQPTLESRLAEIDASFMNKYQGHRDATRLEYEFQLATFRSSLEAQLKDDFVKKIQLFRSTELQQMRQEEKLRYESLLRHKREEFDEMERTIKHKIDLERARLEQSKHALDVRAAELDGRIRASFQQLEDKDQQVALLEQQLRESRTVASRMRAEILKYEDVAAQRLEELQQTRAREQRRIDDIRRLQADNILEQRLFAEIHPRTNAVSICPQDSNAIAALEKPPAVSKVEIRSPVIVDATRHPVAQVIQKPKHEEQSPPRTTREDTTFESPSMDRTNADRQNDHLSQLSSIAPRQQQLDSTHQVDVTQLTSDMSEIIENTNKVAAFHQQSLLETASHERTRYLQSQQSLLASESEERTRNISFEEETRVELSLKCQNEGQFVALNLALGSLSLEEADDRVAIEGKETAARGLVNDDAGTQLKTIEWRMRRDAGPVAPSWQAAQFGGNVVIKSDSDDDGSDLLQRKSDDEDF